MMKDEQRPRYPLHTSYFNLYPSPFGGTETANIISSSSQFNYVDRLSSYFRFFFFRSPAFGEKNHEPSRFAHY